MSWPTASARSKNWSTEILTDADLEAQLDLLHTYFNDSLNGTTGHGHTGGTNDGKPISLSTAVSGTLPLTNGGTGQTTLAGLMNLVYPVGSVYINVSDSTNPGTLLGFGTWAALGAGRMIVGYDAGDTNFDTAGETGGANTVTLTTNELPAHTHRTPAGQAGGGAFNGSQAWSSGATQYGANGLSESTGTGAAFSVLNKYVTCYTWKRTA